MKLVKHYKTKYFNLKNNSALLKITEQQRRLRPAFRKLIIESKDINKTKHVLKANQRNKPLLNISLKGNLGNIITR